mmetsp:Transcript_100040/g.188291  ORF Transcript_100040/g.188291 Transcript_100040/m.188291 type:complete len:637 (+) Transcript_100040:107-2017(+)
MVATSAEPVDMDPDDAEPTPLETAETGAEEDGWAILVEFGVTREELDVCVSVLDRLDASRLDNASCLRRLRKALVPYLHQAFERLPQKQAIDASKRAKYEKNCKRQHRQRQLEADRRWRENAGLRAARLEHLSALEGGPAAIGSGNGAATAAIADQVASEDAAVPTTTAPTRIPDGPARATSESADTADAPEGTGIEYVRQQACYICKARFSERHHFYSHLCPACASLNFTKRLQSCDLSGRVCLVTGARVKIGFETALKLLRMGARVLVTTRFPQDARRRYAAEKDAPTWSNRLEVFGVDFRFLAAVETFCRGLLEREAWLDVIVNNACQTVRRPAAYYKHLLEAEALPAATGDARPAEALQDAAQTAIQISTSECEMPEESWQAPGPSSEPLCDNSAAMSQLAVVAEDRMTSAEAGAVLPAGERDVHGQQLDTRSVNSWLLRLGEVSTPETVEVFCINALTPFILNGRLRPLLERSPNPDRYIVNVSAMEGKFYRYKQPTHPHTNMAKAALNMMTRTSAEDFAKTSGIYMNSVDTGWINDENPLPTARRIAEDHGFQTPIDEIDAAARILDPVLTGVMHSGSATDGKQGVAGVAVGSRRRNGGAGADGAGGEDLDGNDGPVWGRFLKDYMQTEW